MTAPIPGCAKTAADGFSIVLDTTTADVASCQFFLSVPDPTAQFALLGITPESVGGAFGWGFGAVMSFYVLGLIIRAAHDAVKRI